MKRASLLTWAGLTLLVAMGLFACQVDNPNPTGATPTPGLTEQTEPGTTTPSARRSPQAAPTLAATGTPAPTPTSPVRVAAEKLRGLTVTFWHPFIGADALALEALVEAFNQQNTWRIEVRAGAYPGFGDLEDAFRTAQQAGTPPDLLAGYQDQALRWDRSGEGLVDLTAYLQDAEWTLPPEVLESYPAAIWAENLRTSGEDSRRLGLPWYRSGLLLAYNQSWAQELGYAEPPQTVRVFQSQACAAALALKGDSLVENDGRGGWLVAREPGVLVAWLYAFDSSLSAPDSPGYTLDTPQSREAFATLYQGYLGKCFWTDDSATPEEAFASRQALFVTITPPELKEFSAKLAQVGFEDRWRVLALPDLEGSPVADLYGPAFLIPATSPEHQLAAWAFARWMSDPEQQAAWARETGYLPASSAPLAALRTNATEQPAQWRDILALLPLAHGEPARASWGNVRWAFGEALAQLLSPGLRSGDLQAILTNLDRLADDIDSQFP